VNVVDITSAKPLLKVYMSLFIAILKIKRIAVPVHAMKTYIEN
jgi:hypothetical protein